MGNGSRWCLSVQDAEEDWCVIALKTFDTPDWYWRKIADSSYDKVNRGRFIAPMNCGLLRMSSSSGSRYILDSSEIGVATLTPSLLLSRAIP